MGGNRQFMYEDSQKTNEDAWLGLGLSSVHLDRWQEALDAVQTMKDMNPQNGNAWHGIGSCYAHLNRLSVLTGDFCTAPT